MKHRSPTIVAGVAGTSFLLFGAWAMVGSRSFYERMARFDPYNQHFVQDNLGAFQFGLGAVLFLAALAPRLDTLTMALLGTGVGAAAHGVSHVIGRELGGRPASDIPTFVVLAALLLGAGLWHRTRTND